MYQILIMSWSRLPGGTTEISYLDVLSDGGYKILPSESLLLLLLDRQKKENTTVTY